MAKASAQVVDFSNVKERTGNVNPRRVVAGDYLAVIEDVEDTEVKSGDNKGTFQYLFTIKLAKFSQYSYPYYCQLSENQLWKLRNLLIAAGQNVPRKRMKLDPTRVKGKQIGVTMEDDEYDGKPKSVIRSVFPPSELGEGVFEPDDQDDEETEPEMADEAPVETKKGKKKKKKGSSDDEMEALDLDDL